MECAPWSICAGVLNRIPKGPGCPAPWPLVGRPLWASYNICLGRVHLKQRRVLPSVLTVCHPFPCTGRSCPTKTLSLSAPSDNQEAELSSSWTYQCEFLRAPAGSLQDPNCLNDPGENAVEAECGPHLRTRGGHVYYRQPQHGPSYPLPSAPSDFGCI